MSAILSFLGGSAFRAIWGELSTWLNKKQDHKHEMEMIRLQGDMDAAQHARNQIAIRTQAELGIKTVQVQAQAALNQTDADAFRAAMDRAAAPSGVLWIDGWNGSVRPAFATIVLILWLAAMYQQNWVLAAWDMDLMSSICGFFFADRTLGKRGR